MVTSSTPAVLTSAATPEETARCHAGWRITCRDTIALGFNPAVGEDSDHIAGKQTGEETGWDRASRHTRQSTAVFINSAVFSIILVIPLGIPTVASACEKNPPQVWALIRETVALD